MTRATAVVGWLGRASTTLHCTPICHTQSQETPRCLFLCFCHLAFALALSSSVTVGSDRAVLSGIMQIVTSAVRSDAALTLSKRCSPFASAKLDLDLDITAPTFQWTLPPDGHWCLAPGHFVSWTGGTVPPPNGSKYTESSQTPSWLRRRKTRRSFICWNQSFLDPVLPGHGCPSLLDFDCLTVILSRLAMRAAKELPMGIDYALALIFALTVRGETAASCLVPSEPVQEPEGKAPVQAVCVPETPDVTVATSMEAPSAGALTVQVVGHQDGEACGWTADVPSRVHMAGRLCVESCCRAASGWRRHASWKENGGKVCRFRQHEGVSYQLWNTYVYKEVSKAVVAGVRDFVYGADSAVNQSEVPTQSDTQGELDPSRVEPCNAAAQSLYNCRALRRFRF